VKDATLDPVATPVVATEVTSDKLDAEMYMGSYVEVSGPFTVNSVTPVEFENSCNNGTTSVRYVGFAAQGPSSATVAVGLNLFQTVTYCIPDSCSGGSHQVCDNSVSTGQTFQQMRGIIEPHFEQYSKTTFLRLAPTTDEDLQN
jgi:hypothetical protein